MSQHKVHLIPMLQNLCSTFNLAAYRYNSVLDDLVPSDKLPKRLVS